MEQNKMKLIQDAPAGTDFYAVPEEYTAHIRNTYGDKIQFELSVDGTTATSKLSFVDPATVLEYEADPVVAEHRCLRDEYNAAHGIVLRKQF
jgi:hypothetical protein